MRRYFQNLSNYQEKMMNKSNYLELKIYKDLYSDRSAIKNAYGIPYLSKQDIVRGFPLNFMNEHLKQLIEEDKVEYTTTSGTTADRMQIIRNRGWWRKEYESTYKNNPLLQKVISDNMPKAILTTAICSNTVCYLNTPSYEERIINGTLYLNYQHNPWDWSKAEILQIMEEMERFNVYYLDVDPIYFYVFLKKIEEYNITKKLHQPQVITLSYEYSPQNITSYIKKVMSCPVLDLYGTTEFGYVFLTNKNGDLALCPDMLEVDFIPIENSENLYELVVSSVKNEHMPLINYRMGDIVEMDKRQYDNFRNNGTIKRIAGRTKSIIRNCNKVIVTATIDDIIGKHKDIALYQLNILGNQKYNIKIVPFHKWDLIDADLQCMKQELQDLLGTEVFVSVSETIVPELSGKFALIK